MSDRRLDTSTNNALKKALQSLAAGINVVGGTTPLHVPTQFIMYSCKLKSVALDSEDRESVQEQLKDKVSTLLRRIHPRADANDFKVACGGDWMDTVCFALEYYGDADLLNPYTDLPLQAKEVTESAVASMDHLQKDKMEVHLSNKHVKDLGGLVGLANLVQEIKDVQEINDEMQCSMFYADPFDEGLTERKVPIYVIERVPLAQDGRNVRQRLGPPPAVVGRAVAQD